MDNTLSLRDITFLIWLHRKASIREAYNMASIFLKEYDKMIQEEIHKKYYQSEESL